MNGRIITLFVVFLGVLSVYSQNLNEAAVKTYVETYSPVAVRCGTLQNVPPSILLAQALIYTKAGTNHLAKFPNNHMAVTCTKADLDNRYHQDNNTNNICFKKYESVEDSYNDYLKKIKENSLYAPLFKLSITDYRGWANGLQKIGHSTNANYGNMLISLIETYNLDQYDTPPSVSLPAQTVEEVIDTPMIVSLPAQTKETVIDTPPTSSQPIQILEPVEVEIPIQVVIEPVPTEPIRINQEEHITQLVDTTPPLKSKVYTISDLSTLTTVYYSYSDRPVYIKDGIKFIVAVRGDTFEKIGKSVQLPETHLRLYNDLFEYKYQPVEGEVVYIQKKNKKCSVQYHTIEMGESLRYIAQIYGIQLEQIIKRNEEENIGIGYILCISCKK
jgi:LysM repeat protein